MPSRVLYFVLVLVAGAGLGRAQSVIRTLLGGAPDNVPALSATLGTPSAVAADSNGNVYVALKASHQVVRIDPSGIVWLFAGNGTLGTAGDGGPARSASLGTPIALAVDAQGALYIADSTSNRIRKVTPDGNISTFAGSGASGYTGDGGFAVAATLKSPSGVAIDLDGNLLIADTGNQVIRKVTLDGKISTFAGTGTRGGSGDGGPALQANLYSPAGVVVDQARNVYISDTGNDWVRIVTKDGNIARFAGKDTSTIGPGGDPTLAINTALSSPTGLAVDSAGAIYILDSGNVRVRKVTSDGKIANYAGSGNSGASGDGGLAKYANLNPLGIAVDKNDNLLVADGSNNKVRIVTVADGIINTLAGSGISSYSVRGMAISGDTLYFSDNTANRVRRLNLVTGELALVAGNGVAYFDGDGGDAAAAELSGPRGLAIDSSGRLYIADTGNQRVRMVDTAGKISTIAGTGTATSTGDGGAATSATLNEPVAVATDTSGNLYIVERSGQRIRKVTGTTITTFAGTGVAGAPAAESGNATDQNVNFPQGLTFESGGSLLLSDTNNNRVRRLAASGAITTVVGSGTNGYAGDGGLAVAAALKIPAGASSDSAGNIYIADTNNHAIRRVGSDGIITTIAGLNNNGAPVGGYNGDGSPATAYSLNGPTSVLPASGCSVIIADTANQRIRRLWPAEDFLLSTTPPGLQVSVDSQNVTTPFTAGLLPGTSHHFDAPSPQNGPAGTRYLKTSAPQDVSVTCGPARAAVNFAFKTQYAINAVAKEGGSISSYSTWQDSGAQVTLTAAPNSGYVFAGWDGACIGLGNCQLTMDGPKTVLAYFAPSQTLNPAISSGGIVGAGLSTPVVRALSTNAIASVFGANFAPAGTFRSVVVDDLVNGKVPTRLAGVCVLVGSTMAPLFTVTPAQINFQVPQVPSSGTADVRVVTACGASSEVQSAPQTVALQAAAPEFFYFVQNAGGKNPVATLNAITGGYIGAPGLIPGATFAPAKPGDILTLFATGLGPTAPAFAAGELPAAAGQVTSAYQITLGSTALAASDVSYAGVAPGNAGLYQINLRLPDAVPDGDQPVVITINGISSPTGAFITVKR